MPLTTSQVKLESTPRTRIQQLLNHAAKEMLYIPPAEWGRWVAYFLEALEANMLLGDFNDVLFDVQSSLSQRLCHGEW